MNAVSRPKRHHFLWVMALAVALGTVAFACGSDDSTEPGACAGPTCDGGVDTSTSDAPSTDDGAARADGGRDADSAVPTSCADGGAPGALDESFGDGGLVWLKYPGGQAFAVAAQTDGKIVVAGGTTTVADGGGPTRRNFAVVRLLPDGTPDPSFGKAGLAENTILSIDTQPLRAVAIQPDGKIVAAGPAIGPGPTSYDFVVLRYNVNGTLDTTFGNAGATVTDFGNTDDYPRSVALQPDGRILVAGQSQTNAMLPTQNFNVARYNTDGSLDTTFGTGGKVTIDVKGTPDMGGYVAVMPDNRIVVVGATGNVGGGSPYEMAAVRLNSDGSIDTTFANAGSMVTSLGGGSDHAAYSVVTDSAGRIVLGGATGADFGLLRLTSAGGIDATFGDGGLVATRFVGGRSGGIGSVLADEAGRLVAAGTSSVGAQSDTGAITVARYQPTGSLDLSFGAAGVSMLASPPNTTVSAAGAALGHCSIVTVGTWGYDISSVNKIAMGVARFHQ